MILSLAKQVKKIEIVLSLNNGVCMTQANFCNLLLITCSFDGDPALCDRGPFGPECRHKHESARFMVEHALIDHLLQSLIEVLVCQDIVSCYSLLQGVMEV